MVRYWYIWLDSKNKSDLDSVRFKLSSTQQHTKKKTKQQYFISLPSLFSIEINSHTLVYLGLLVMQHHLPPQCLDVSVFNSQSCESTFRSCRAMSGPFSSIVNFNVHQFLQRVKKLSYLNSIKCRNNGNNTNNDFLFPRHHKLSNLTDSTQISSLSSSPVPLSLEAIEKTVLRAYSDVCRLVVDMNMYQEDQLLSLEDMSKLANLQLMKSRIVDYSSPDTYDPDFYSDSDDSSSEDENATGNDADDENSFDDDGDDDNFDDNLTNVSTSTFHGMRIFNSINPTLSSSYFSVNINGIRKFLHKQTAVWLLSKDKPTLSSDRLRRVMAGNK